MTFGDYLRLYVVWAQEAAGVLADAADLYGKLADRGMSGLADRRDETRRAIEYMEQVAGVNAAQGIAHDEMMAAGGSGNSRAYVEYEAMTRRHQALLPKDALG
ncbi:hypothetical protein SAMN04489732_13114 [Amycolatopsis saalfeldensis]|uniref:Uncharacterized protein n=2 Tax=Amycolatopsis saalfeldensis TaxID=394193 RepID=A0A1H8YNJ7_9PSEU|nr:hypothetical protein SAMN04489732_13114 [Amycolatopsis saalfeldensis]